MSTTSSISPISSNIITPSTTKVGLGYGIAIAISILFLISSILLASYACVRVKAGNRDDDEDENDHNVGDNVDRPHQRDNLAHQPISIGLPGPMQIKVGLEKKPNKELTYNEVVLGESKRLPRPNNGPCSICLSEYKPKEIVRCMPHCNHCFHVKCIDQWLKVGPTCPLCRNSPAATPSATPLSELVPLAFHPR
ncbi:hypothetical protein RND81_10G094300 [Saponaria officinalis]|uniref:RING-type domain-containing protein n=1 Tax=Saponaria officinalis TaxID=3572 RepID=A0AAW1I189_SAPOF